MLTKNELKHYASLQKKKYRKISNKFIIEGKKLVEEGLKSSYSCELVLFTEHFLTANRSVIESIEKRNIKSELVTNIEFKKLSDTNSPQGIAAVFKIPEDQNNFVTNDKLIVALENISDPGNLGTIIRTCDWFGIKNIFISGESVDVFNSKVLRSSMGSIFHLNVLVRNNIYSSLKQLQRDGYKIVCADLNGKDVFRFDINSRAVLVFCNEAGGPSEGLLEIADEIITIPKLGEAESLNVASASAVIISQLTK